MPQMQPPPQQHPIQAWQQQPPAVEQGGGQHLHFHGMTPEQIAAALRQLRGGQQSGG